MQVEYVCIHFTNRNKLSIIVLIVRILLVNLIQIIHANNLTLIQEMLTF